MKERMIRVIREIMLLKLNLKFHHGTGVFPNRCRIVKQLLNLKMRNIRFHQS